MDLKKYNKLRKKINTKDFEGSNSGLDKWLYRFSFVGNISSIFFAYFLVFPSLKNAVSLNFMEGTIGLIISIILTVVFLSIFEIIKRYLVSNFSNDFLKNKRKLKMKTMSWFLTSIGILFLSFYLSVAGSSKFAITSTSKNKLLDVELAEKQDSISSHYSLEIVDVKVELDKLILINDSLRNIQLNTPLNYMTARKEYQNIIDKNVIEIQKNQDIISTIKDISEHEKKKVEVAVSLDKMKNTEDDDKNMLLFIIIAIFNELIIVAGLYFREFFEHQLFVLNQEKYEKIYQRKERYLSLTKFIYENGKYDVGDKLISGTDLKSIVATHTKVDNANKFVDEYLRDMDRLGVYIVKGKRRFFNLSYEDALTQIEEYDNNYRVLENLE